MENWMKTSIINANINSKENKRNHVSEINKKVFENKKSIKANLCPKCGNTLVTKKGKYGSFIGCSNYPKCRFTTSKS